MIAVAAAVVVVDDSNNSKPFYLLRRSLSNLILSLAPSINLNRMEEGMVLIGLVIVVLLFTAGVVVLVVLLLPLVMIVLLLYDVVGPSILSSTNLRSCRYLSIVVIASERACEGSRGNDDSR